MSHRRTNRERRADAGGGGWRRWLAIGAMAVLCAAGAGAAPAPARVESEGQSISAGPHLMFARDPTGRVGIEDRAALDWVGGEEGRNRGGKFGYTADAVWARLEVENGRGGDVDARLTLRVARLGRATWWLFDGERMVDQVESGLDAAGGGRGGGRHPELAFRLLAGERREVFLRVESDTAIWIDLSLETGATGAGKAAGADFAEQAFVGAGAAMFLMAVIFGAAQRNRMYVFLAATIGAFMGYYLLFHGYYAWLGGPGQRWANRNLVLALGVAGHWALLEFTRAHRGAPGGGSGPWLRRVSVGVAAGAVVVCVVPFRLGLVAMMALLGVCFAAGMPASLRLASRSRAWPHRLLAGVWLLVALLLATTYADLYAWLPGWMEPAYSQRAFLLTFFLMAFSIVAGQRMLERRDRERALLAEQSATAAQLQALRYQLNPHFLYNTLTSIDALSRQAPQRIPELVRKLATYLRLRLHASADGLATVESEMDSIRAYLDIEQVRFEDSLRVTYEIEAGVEGIRVPEMVFQPLVENAIKHGMPPEGALEVTIRVARAGGGCRSRWRTPGNRGAVGI